MPQLIQLMSEGPSTYIKQLRCHLPSDLEERCVCWMFGMTVIGQLWMWPLAVALLSVLLSRGMYTLALALVTYCAYINGPGYAVAENEAWPTPLQRWRIWRLQQRYFQARVIKTADLEPQGRYVLAAYPHGVSAIAAWTNFVTAESTFGKVFPSLQVYGMTLASNFRTPGVREWCLLHGLRSCSRRACRRMLQRPGCAILLVPGGAAEALLASPGTMDIILRKRKGFVRIALCEGASLVPIINFGENELFDTWIPPPGSTVARLQQASHRHWGTSQPLFSGVGVFTDNGLLPHRRPLTSVVGAPIPVKRWAGPCEGPDFDAAVERYHAQYTSALCKLYDRYKDELAPDRVRDLRIVA